MLAATQMLAKEIEQWKNFPSCGATTNAIGSAMGFPVRSIFSYNDSARNYRRFCCWITLSRRIFPPLGTKARGRRPPAPRVRDGHDCLQWRGRASRLLGRGRHRPSRRRAMDDGGLGARARGVSRFGICQARRAVRDDPVMGQSVRETSKPRLAIKTSPMPKIPRVDLPSGAGSARDRGLPRNAGPRAYF
jgi:hypothetical protein